MSDIWAMGVLGLTMFICLGLAVFGIWWIFEVGFNYWDAVVSVGIPMTVASVFATVLTRDRSIRLSGAITVTTTAFACLTSAPMALACSI